jgi:antitoxin (DNA-binding transcriptional repressor) of toxin-antitoxin stability system
MYTVHMKHVTATEARKNWFRLLDEVAGGETLVIEREGISLVLQRQAGSKEDLAARVPRYEGLLRADDLGNADRWTWEWSEESGDLSFKERDQ